MLVMTMVAMLVTSKSTIYDAISLFGRPDWWLFERQTNGRPYAMMAEDDGYDDNDDIDDDYDDENNENDDDEWW